MDDGGKEAGEKVDHLKKRLAFLEQAAALPPQDPDDPDSQLGPGPPLLLKFGLLRLGLNDSAEQATIKMLAGPTGAGIAPGKPFAAVMFGRGRVLGAWPLEEVTDTVLEDASMFLIGRCSCRIKNENPGWDVLLNIDWTEELPKVRAEGPQSSSLPHRQSLLQSQRQRQHRNPSRLRLWFSSRTLSKGQSLQRAATCWLFCLRRC